MNYGHTIGHAVEAASGFELLHGEAVSIGIIAAGLIEIEMQLTEPGRLDRIRQILQKLSVPVTLPKDLADIRAMKISSGIFLASETKAEAFVPPWPLGEGI